MTKYLVTPTNKEVFFDKNQIIVSKTDLKGRITYANDVFCHIAGYHTREVIGAPHSLIRHPDMPRSVFKLLWDTIAEGKEIFAYVKNMAKSGDHYWVLAHVTASYDDNGTFYGYHSNRRVPERQALEKIIPLYQELLSIEKAASNEKTGMNDAVAALQDKLATAGVTYEQFVWGL